MAKKQKVNKKRTNKNHTSPPKPQKYYAVRNGREIGIFTSWPKCKSLVDHYRNAEYKSFKTYEAAEKWYLGDEFEEIEKEKRAKEIEENDFIEKMRHSNITKAYVDGSFDKNRNRYSCGVVLIQNKEVVFKFSKGYDDPENAKFRNVSGELMGAMAAIQYCLDNKIPELCIYHDYSGISEWANGKWSANKSITKQYKNMVIRARKKMVIHFVKVKAHTGIYYNELADRLAKEALR